jgi:hypothetical protein
MAIPKPQIFVSARHLADGIRRSKTLCPVAMAIDAAGLGPAEVDMDNIRGGSTVFKTPPEVAQRILEIDSGETLPFAFQWPVPAGVRLA